MHCNIYEVGTIPQLFEPENNPLGFSLDWVLGVAGIPYVYVMELGDTRWFGFCLPAHGIMPTTEEVWAQHEVAAREIMEVFGKDSESDESTYSEEEQHCVKDHQASSDTELEYDSSRKYSVKIKTCFLFRL